MAWWVAGVVVVCFVGGWLFNYPCDAGHWRYSVGLGAGERAARKALRAARSAKRDTCRAVDLDVAQAERRLSDGIRKYEQRLRERKAAKEALLRTGPGEKVAPGRWLGELELYEHALLFVHEEDRGDGEPRKRTVEQWSLAALKVTRGTGQTYAYIEVMGPKGKRRSARYPYTEYDEAAVHLLHDEICNQVVEDADFWRERHADAAEVDAEIARLKAELARTEETGRAEVAKAEKHAATERERVGALLRAAQDTWKDQAGRRPRR
ncbi:hypothetical protein [Streptomyces sp. NPDC057257]|uniref:hypothetical protein n=1 Tax=Streptomyces sp. NPDC057257 TaxID=3346071 RepID=UPI003643194F